MLTQQRHEIILKLLKEKGSITVTEVRDLLDTSESTVRRDITALDKEGKLEKVFGGAVEAGQKVTAHEYTVAQKNELNCDAKRKIAEYAASLIEPDDFVFLDAGTTTAHMIDFIRATSAVFVTNAVAHAQRLASRGFKVDVYKRQVVDATRDLLMKVLPYHPFLIKPNNHELGEIFGVELKTRESVVPYAKQLQEKGAQNVLVSMAGEGAVLVAASGEVFEAPAPKGKLINGVGAGDSMVAGFMAGYMEKEDYLHAFHMGIAAGSASAFSENLATREEIASVYEQITK